MTAATVHPRPTPSHQPSAAAMERTARRRGAHARGNTLVLVTAILVLLVILATAFLVRAQSGRAQAAASQKAAGREARIDTVGEAMAQEIADALFVRRIDSSSMAAQIAANQATGLTNSPLFGEFLARSDFPRLPPEPAAIRYGVDYFDLFTNNTLVSIAGGDGFLDGYNFAPYSTIPFTNWPARYGVVAGEGNPVGNPGFGDSRWLAATEPMRALTAGQFLGGTAPFPTATLGVAGAVVQPAPPGQQVAPSNVPNNWSNLALINNLPILSPEGLGFSHWPHLTWIATAENGYRVCWDISDIEGVVNGTPNTLTGLPGTVQGELSLGTPYEQWLPFVPPREPTINAKDSRGYLVLDPTAWTTRVRDWFNVGTTNFGAVPPHAQMIKGVNAAGVSAPARRWDALPNFLQLGAFGNPADEYKVYTPNDTIPAGFSVGSPTSRNLIARTLADADGDGWTDSFWFLAPASSDRSTRQLVAVRIMDNSALLNVNVATRFDKTTTIGQTPADLALVTRRESFDETTSGGQSLAGRDVPVGFFNSRENDPEYRLSFSFRVPAPVGAPTPNKDRLVYHSGTGTVGGGSDGGLDVGWNPVRWEGSRTQPAGASAATYQPSMLRLLGLMQEGAPGQPTRPVPLFDATNSYGLAAPGGAGYGGWFMMTRPADRLTYFKAMANNGELTDPVTAARLVTLTPFGQDDEVELRSANGLNTAATISRLEIALNDSYSANSDQVTFGQALRSSRSREETARYLSPDDRRMQDWRARAAWAPNAAFASRSGSELLLDHRRLLTTISGARNEELPPRLWSVIDHTSTATSQDVTRTRPAYVRRGVDFDQDGQPDDVTGDGQVNLADDLSPYHPLIMFPGATPRGDGNGDGRVDYIDTLLARQRFLQDNRKIDLRRPNDPPSGTGTAASAATIAANDRQFAVDLQRVLRRALIDEGSRQSYFGKPGESATETGKSLAATKLMTASFAANVLSYRDSWKQVTNTLALDQPLHPTEAIPVPSDAVSDPSIQNAGFIGVEKQPFFQEVFVAFVYPKTKLSQGQIDAVTGPPGNPNSGCPDSANCQVDSGDPGKLPPCTANGAGEHFVTYDPADPATWPAVVFVCQLANPYNTPVSLADFELRINPASGAPQRFFFGIPGPSGTKSGNIYGPDVELGPTTVEEPRTAIVFSIPERFPNGDPFPRDAWLDFLDLRQAITDTDPSNDTKPGQTFPPDPNAIFAPAWGGGTLETQNKRGGTLYFDATRTTAPAYAGLDVSGNMDRWKPSQSNGGAPPASFVELRRAIYPSLGGTPTWTVVDRFENELDPAAGNQSFRDNVLRLYTDEHLPPKLDIECRQGKLAIDGIRIRNDDYYTTWARGARQWLFDTQNGVTGTPAGRGIISLDERTPRYVFSRLTGVDRVQATQSDAYVGGVQTQRKGATWAQTDPPDGTSANPVGTWLVMDYFNVWGEPKRGKPTFLPTRIYEQLGSGQSRRYDYPAWRLTNATPLSGTVLSFGEKGVTDSKFVNGASPDNFIAPLRMFQKDADFDQAAEILDVPLWGPLVERSTSGRTYATLSEILAQPADSTNTLLFPKTAVGGNPAYYNRLQLDPAVYDTTAGVGGRATMLSGTQVLPPVVDTTVAGTPNTQNGIGFNSRLPGGASLLDAFVVDDRGAQPFDSDRNGTIDFMERATAENRRLRLARGFEGKLTPGLLNVNTAPVEVLRAMPHMTRLVYNDDENIDGLKTIRDNTLQQATNWNLGNVSPGPAVPESILFDWGVPAPRVRVPEAIDLWRSKANVLPDLSNHLFGFMPSYYSRGIDLPTAQNNREWAADMRSERGFDSLGELALLTKGAEFRDPANPAAADIGNSWNQLASWSTRYAGQNPFRTWWDTATSGAGYNSLVGAGPAVPPLPQLAYRTDGIPKSTAANQLQFHPLSGRTSIDSHRLTVATDDGATPDGAGGAGVETDDPATTAVLEREAYRFDLTAGDALEQNSLLKGISNLTTVRSDVFTVWIRVRTIRQDPLTGKWNATDPESIIDDSRYMMTVDRSGVDSPGQRPRILSFVKVED
ncbi:MAG: hypothetical protein U0625_10630 [Phycisphaerales bacterium]